VLNYASRQAAGDVHAPGLSVDAACAIAIRAQRVDMAVSMLESAIRRHEVTIGCELLALSLVDHFADAVETRSWPAFFAWIDSRFDSHAVTDAVPRLLTLAIASIAASLEDVRIEGRAPQTDFGQVAERIRRIAARPRSVRAVPGNQSLDEIDVALDRLMLRLTNFDLPTADHSRAVSMWCARIAKKLSLSTTETTFVTRAGLIHDIGKVTTPPAILNAPYRLSDAEMDIMRGHAAAGAVIVSEIALLARLVPPVRNHHERVDGRGYPDGHAGADIPLAVRIVSVADSFNAMIGNRPYRLPMPPTQALEELKRYRDTQFDPNVVNAMIDVVAPRLP
jgi:putative nucleotidyltransferase with HDIG domain